MSKGFLDDIIEQISVKKPSSMSWIAPPQQQQSTQQIPVQQQQQFYQQQLYQPQQQFSPVNNNQRQQHTPQIGAMQQYQQYQPVPQMYTQQMSYQPQQQQQQPQQQFMHNSSIITHQQPQFDYETEIKNLQKNLSQLPVTQLQNAFNLLVNLVENLGSTVEASRGLQGLPKISKSQISGTIEQESTYQTNDLMTQVIAKRQQNKSQIPSSSFEKQLMQTEKSVHGKRLIQFPTLKAIDRWTEALLGQFSTKIQRLTLDTADKYFWLDKNVQKVFWSNTEGQAACGSFSLCNILYILVGQHSIDYTKAKISYSDVSGLVSSQSVPVKPQISIINDKRDINIIFPNIEKCDIWVAALTQLQKLIKVIY
ncbi:hypothetical protein SS50377_20926 [Spironucleus salmonicida]|uniref:PH domain-containing protein n=1 Tax=Spironucleus salmonicida TaxID=348837 RepID=V6LS41_9EUKA|nr:hypothetical protein SS50377_20926 [Spironucleus salmonicida]|eukprot:EST43599.1 Hypothetical protein SS50377_16641 [Spironucleus salmonicida]